MNSHERRINVYINTFVVVIGNGWCRKGNLVFVWGVVWCGVVCMCEELSSVSGRDMGQLNAMVTGR